MSYILEALKKAEQQREIGQVPGIDSEHEPALAGLSSRWAVIVVLVLLINAALLVVLFWPDDQAEVSTQVASPQALSPGIESMPQPSANAQSHDSVVLQTRPALVLPQAPAIAKKLPTTQPVPVTPQVVVAPVPSPVTAAVAPAPAPAIPAPVPASQPAPFQRVRDLPVWPQVPAHIFQQLQSGLRLDVHVYSDRLQDRFVLINLQKYREGERLQEGAVLDEITSEGIVLSLQGQQFLVRAK